MSLIQRNEGRRLFLVFGGFLAAASLAFMASRLDFWPSATPSAPPLPPPAKAAGSPPEPGAKPVPTPKPVQPVHEGKQKPTGEPVPAKGAPGASPALASPDQDAGNLAVLTSLRAELEEAKLRTAIAQEREKQVAKAPAVVLAPPPAVQGASPPVPKAPEKPREATPVVVSVQGVDGSTTATIRVRGKLTTVKVGETFGNGVVSSITRDGVAVKNGRAVTTYRFE